MGIIRALNRIDRRYAWSLLGFVFAIIFGGITLYTEFLRDTRPNLTFEIVSDASVLDVREPLGDLQIVYGGVDIQKTKESLRVLVVRVSNNGLQDILRGHYDDRSPLGFKLHYGSLLRVEHLSASNEYIGDNLGIRIANPQTAVFAPLIIESQEWFIFKSLVLHTDGTRPSIEPIGKVAGVRAIRLVDTSAVAARPGFWSRAFAGSVWVQLARLALYTLAFILFVGAFVGTVVSTSEFASKRRRRRHIIQFKAITTRKLDHRDEVIFDHYLKDDKASLVIMHRFAADQAKLNAEMEVYESRGKNGELIHAFELASKRTDVEHGHLLRIEEEIHEGGHRVLRQVYQSPLHFLRVARLKEAGIIRMEDDRWLFDDHARDTLTEFLKFVDPKMASVGERVVNLKESNL